MITEARYQFWQHIYETLKKNPEWLGGAISAIQEGITARLHDEQHKRALAEAAVVMAYDNKKPSAVQDAAIRKIICESNLVAGTSYAERLAKGLMEESK